MRLQAVPIPQQFAGLFESTCTYRQTKQTRAGSGEAESQRSYLYYYYYYYHEQQQRENCGTSSLQRWHTPVARLKG
jgi:hypothetical protein